MDMLKRQQILMIGITMVVLGPFLVAVGVILGMLKSYARVPDGKIVHYLDTVHWRLLPYPIFFGLACLTIGVGLLLVARKSRPTEQRGFPVEPAGDNAEFARRHSA